MSDLAKRIDAAAEAVQIKTPEYIAKEAGCSALDVVRHQANEQTTFADGAHFVEAMQDMRSWGELMFLVHTPDVILEVKTEMPDGALGHGFYNLKGKPTGGHLKAGNCGTVGFITSSFMGTPTKSVQFFNREGGCMFKIYLSRDSERNFLPEQLQAYENLQARLCECATAAE